MLKILIYVLAFAAVGAILGLIFSNKGEEGQGMLSGAKEGAKVGCGCILIPILIIVIIALVLLI